MTGAGRCPAPPRVTVLMPVYDGEAFLDGAIASVLDQSWPDFELLIIDDGSTDGSGAIADAYAAADARVRVEHVAHGGLVAALNRGLETIATELIARADADDVNHRERLARQVAFLDAHPEVGVCGCWMDSLPPGTRWTLPERWDVLRSMLLFGAPVRHPTVMMRRDWIARSGCRYDAAFTHAEDYDFWERAARLTRFANLPAALVQYRRHAQQATVVHGEAQRAGSRAVRLRQLHGLGIVPTPEETELHEHLAASTCGRTLVQLDDGWRWLERLRDANRRTDRYPEPAFSQVLAERWYRNCAEAALQGLAVAAIFTRTDLVWWLPGGPWRRALRLRALQVLPIRASRWIARQLSPAHINPPRGRA